MESPPDIQNQGLNEIPIWDYHDYENDLWYSDDVRIRNDFENETGFSDLPMSPKSPEPIPANLLWKTPNAESPPNMIHPHCEFLSPPNSDSSNSSVHNVCDFHDPPTCRTPPRPFQEYHGFSEIQNLNSDTDSNQNQNSHWDEEQYEHELWYSDDIRIRNKSEDEEDCFVLPTSPLSPEPIPSHFGLLRLHYGFSEESPAKIVQGLPTPPDSSHNHYRHLKFSPTHDSNLKSSLKTSQVETGLQFSREQLQMLRQSCQGYPNFKGREDLAKILLKVA